MIFGAILAGGTGSRMGLTNMPKQFLELGDKPIIIHTLQKFLLNLKFDVIYLGIHENWTGYMEDLIEKYIADEENKKRIKIISGGIDRNSTIMNIVEDIEENYTLNSEDVIVTHDAVRPFITSRILEENIEMSLQYGACDTVIPAIDTIVVSENNKIIKDMQCEWLVIIIIAVFVESCLDICIIGDAHVETIFFWLSLGILVNLNYIC